MISKAYIKWNQAPIIVTFSEKATPVWDIPFPAVTICPEAKVSTAKLNLSAEMDALNPVNLNANSTFNADTIGKLKAVAQVCYGVFQLKYFHLIWFSGNNESNVFNILKEFSPNKRESFDCAFGNDLSLNCIAYMKQTITEHGLCYSFNMLPEDKIFRKDALHNDHAYMENWNENEYNNENVATPYPLHATDAGFQAGLNIYLQTALSDIDYKCTDYAQGYKLVLHEPSEYPQVSKHHIRVTHGQEMSVAVKPQMITTSKSAADYHWSKRLCFFENERYLRFFQLYNQENCELECLTNATLAVCGCVRFSMPRAPGMKVCSFSDVTCWLDPRSYFKNLYLPYKPSSGNKTMAESNAFDCNCLPVCSSIQYDVEITRSPRDYKEFFKAYEIVDDNRFLRSTVYIYFKDTHFIPSRRTELYGMVDFLANCGGLMGLFMGVSILSLLEICYYITIRPYSLRKQLTRRSTQEMVKIRNEDNNALLAVITKAD